jgi:hypothetical protein
MTTLQADYLHHPLPHLPKDGGASTLSTPMISDRYMIEYWAPTSPSSPFSDKWRSRAGGDSIIVYDKEVTGIYPGK